MPGFDELLASIGAGEEYIEPASDCVLLRPVELEPTTKGGLYVPAGAKRDAAPVGVVLAVGPCLEPKNIEPGDQTVCPGDRVVYSSGWERDEVDVNGDRLVIIRAHAILGIFRRKGA